MNHDQGFDPTGAVQWNFQLGTAGTDEAHAIARDTDGNLFIVGDTDGDLGGSPNSGATDIFIVKLNAAGVLQ